MLFTDAIRLGLDLGLSITDKNIILVPTDKKTMYGYRYRKGKLGKQLFYMSYWDDMTDSRNADWEIIKY
jgi:hypothetical protein